MMQLSDFQNQINYLRAARYQSKAEETLSKEYKTQFDGIILNYNSISGLYSLKLEDGRFIYAKSINNSGGSGNGSTVSVYLPQNGTPMFDYF